MSQTWQGMRYPDAYVTRFFFKNGLQQRPGSVLELGCGSGSNLRVFVEHGYATTGLDYAEDAVDACRHNLAAFPGVHRALRCDLEDGLPADVAATAYDVVMLPNILNYLRRETVAGLLAALPALLTPGGCFLCIVRLCDDYRYGRGTLAARDEFLLEAEETGEKGTRQTFFSEHEFVALTARSLGVDPLGLVVLRNRFENFQAGRVIANSDLVVWGRRDR